MNFTIGIYQNPAKLTFEKVRMLQKAVARYDSSVEFDGYSGCGTLYTHDPMHHEALREAEEAGMELTDACGPRPVSFSDYFGPKVKLDVQKVLIYCQMCIEGRIR